MVVVSVSACLSDTPGWDQLKAFYAYDADDLMETEAKVEQAGDMLRVKLTYSGHDGEKVPAILLLPKTEGRVPVVVLVHGMGGSKEQMLDRFGRAIVDAGAAAFAFDAIYQKERSKGAPSARDITGFTEMFRSAVVDARRGIDYLRTRKDVDAKRVALLGLSFGSGVVAVAGAVDARFRQVTLLLGGDTARFRAEIPGGSSDEVEFVITTNFVPHISPRSLLMFSGKNDPVVKPEVAEKLFVISKEPKELVWMESEHNIPADAVSEIVKKTLERLGR